MNRSFRLAFAFGLAALAGSTAAQSARQTYIVQLVDPPAATYAGQVAGIASTQPVAGAKLNVGAANVRAYMNYLGAKHAGVLAQVGTGATVLHRYTVAFNGFAALLTPDEARTLKTAPGVVAITRDEPRPMDTTRTPAFLGLSNPGGFWSLTDAQARTVKGEDVIIGVVDGGIWPEDPSFSDKVDAATQKPVSYSQAGTQVYGPPPAKWKGGCVAGQGFDPATMCNNKLIGAQYFNAGFNASGRPLWPTDYVGPRDEDGHGSHTASTAGGNERVDAFINGSPVGAISGMAPRARIAAYRTCWSYVEAVTLLRKNGCFPSDSVAAIDKAVADGVDVINFSISGTSSNYLDPVEVAFFNASAAGVFVAASAGNSGPANTVSHMSPWLTTVAASTHDRFTVATVTLGNGATFRGPSYQIAGVPSTPLILSDNAGVQPFASLSAADQTALRRCYSADDRTTLGGSANAALDPAKVAGKMVVCIRGGNVLVNKAIAVKQAGGAAMILQNAAGTANTTALLPFVVPAVHLTADAAPTVVAYAATPGATASFGPGEQISGVVAPVMADFSSRGPSLADRNVLKPDLSAPGVDIIAAFVSDDSNQQSVHDAIVGGATPSAGATSIQGTSMSSPHVAGSAALMKQLHPTWSPAAIKSALMTSAGTIKLADGTPDPARFGYGAGHLNPNGAADPGLVYDAGPADYLRFLCGIGALSATGSTCSSLGAISPWNLNLASITAADVLGRITITRTVKNLGAATATYNGTANLAGWDTSVTPSSLTLAPGGSASYAVRLTRTSASVGDWAFGDVTWTDGLHQVKSPLTVRGALFASAGEIVDTRAAGAKVITVGAGYDGRLTTTPTGLVPATRSSGSVATNAQQCFNVAVPAGTLVARFRLYDSETQGGAASDLDLEVHSGPGGTGPVVGSSGSGTSEEQVDLTAPAAGTYSACVIGYAPAGGNAAFTLSSWVVAPSTSPQTLRAAGAAKVALGGTASIAVSWAVPSSIRYLGGVQFGDGTGAPFGTTLVSIDTH